MRCEFFIPLPTINALPMGGDCLTKSSSPGFWGYLGPGTENLVRESWQHWLGQNHSQNPPSMASLFAELPSNLQRVCLEITEPDHPPKMEAMAKRPILISREKWTVNGIVDAIMQKEQTEKILHFLWACLPGFSDEEVEQLDGIFWQQFLGEEQEGRFCSFETALLRALHHRQQLRIFQNRIEELKTIVEGGGVANNCIRVIWLMSLRLDSTNPRDQLLANFLVGDLVKPFLEAHSEGRIALRVIDFSALRLSFRQIKEKLPQTTLNKGLIFSIEKLQEIIGWEYMETFCREHNMVPPENPENPVPGTHRKP